MNPTGPLKTEHRLIERMLALLDKEAAAAATTQRLDTDFLDDAVDFIRWYADKTHHAKEEFILFKEVAQKELAPEDRLLMQELIDEHDHGRRTVTRLIEEKERYLRGSREALTNIRDILGGLTAFYREHIRKEDDIFFPACLKYLSPAEQAAMLQTFWEADRKMIHAKYESLVLQHEKTRSPGRRPA